MTIKKGFFITGTDTGVGKTRVALALVHALRRQGLRVAVMKPVAAGVVAKDSRPEGRSHGDCKFNEDAIDLIRASGLELPYERVNPYLFAEPVAPHLVAAQTGVIIEPARVCAEFALLAEAADIVVVEGAGGWLVPIGPDATMADLAVALGLPVLLVVGMRLGCLNHALLTADAVIAQGLELAGWVANCVDPEMSRLEDNIRALEERLPAPRRATLPWAPGADPSSLADALNMQGPDWTGDAPSP